MKHGRQLHHRAAKRGCEVVSGLEVVRDFLKKVVLELGGEEPWKFWGMAFQAEREAAREAWFNPSHSHNVLATYFLFPRAGFIPYFL